MCYIPGGWLKYDVPENRILRMTKAMREANEAAAEAEEKEKENEDKEEEEDEEEEEEELSDEDEQQQEELYYKFDDPAPLSPPKSTKKCKATKKVSSERRRVLQDMSNMQNSVDPRSKPAVQKRSCPKDSYWQEEEKLGKYDFPFRILIVKLY